MELSRAYRTTITLDTRCIGIERPGLYVIRTPWVVVMGDLDLGISSAEAYGPRVGDRLSIETAIEIAVLAMLQEGLPYDREVGYVGLIGDTYTWLEGEGLQVMAPLPPLDQG